MRILGLKFVDLFQDAEQQKMQKFSRGLYDQTLTGYCNIVVGLHEKLLSVKTVAGCSGSASRIIILRDIRVEEPLKIRLQHAQKMDAISVLTGGIACDFNNVLTAIMGNISLAIQMLMMGADCINVSLVRKGLPPRHPAVQTSDISAESLKTCGRFMPILVRSARS